MFKCCLCTLLTESKFMPGNLCCNFDVIEVKSIHIYWQLLMAMLKYFEVSQKVVHCFELYIQNAQGHNLQSEVNKRHYFVLDWGMFGHVLFGWSGNVSYQFCYHTTPHLKQNNLSRMYSIFKRTLWNKRNISLECALLTFTPQGGILHSAIFLDYKLPWVENMNIHTCICMRFQVSQ